jgi:hypothetical protein
MNIVEPCLGFRLTVSRDGLVPDTHTSYTTGCARPVVGDASVRGRKRSLQRVAGRVHDQPPNGLVHGIAVRARRRGPPDQTQGRSYAAGACGSATIIRGVVQWIR